MNRRRMTRMLTWLACAFSLATSPADAPQAEHLGDEYQALRDYHAHSEAREAAEQEAEARQKAALERSADPSFRPFVDLVALGEAWGDLDSARFAADSLRLLEGERTHRRGHRATPAAPILAASVRLAAACGDLESLHRLIAAFEKDPSLAELDRQAKQARARLAPAGEKSATPSHAGNAIESATAHAYEHAFLQNIRAAVARGDGEVLGTLAATVDELKEVPEARRVILRRAAGHAAELNRALPPLTPEACGLLEDLAAITPEPHHGREEVRPVEREIGGPGHDARGLSGHDRFTRKYHQIRKRFVSDFLYNGQVAAWYSDLGRSETFSDQTYHAGFALLTFAGEARVLARSGADPKGAEAVVGQVLRAIETLDGPAVRALTLKPGPPYKIAEPGFFVRDWVTASQLNHPTAVAPDPSSSLYTISSDFQSDQGPKPGTAAPSVDQYVSLFMGWWAVAHWSTDRGNVRLARSQADRAMSYLMKERFMMDFPGTTNEASGSRGGGDARAAAGFLCEIAGETTGHGLDYFRKAKVRLMHNNRCTTCAGSGLVRAPNPNLQCPTCHGTGHLKVVVGGGKCLACRGTGEMKVVVGGECPACRGSGKMKVVWTDFWGHDHTSYSSNCKVCGGTGHIGTTTKLGKCKFCHGSGHLAQHTKDLGRCKLCGGSGRWKGTLPKIKCPVCGGTGEWNLYVRDTHPVLLALEPLGLVAMVAPHFQLQSHAIDKLKHGTMPKITVDYATSHVVKAYVRHLMLVCMAHELLIDTSSLYVAAESSNHPWSIALRAAKMGSFLPTHLGKLPGEVVMVPIAPQLARIHHECPAQGPSDNSPTWDWVKDNRWERCTDLLQTPHVRPSTAYNYNGLDFLSLEVLMRLNGYSKLLTD